MEEQKQKKDVRRTMTPEAKQRLSEALRNYYKNPDNKKKLKERWTPEARKALSKRQKEIWTKEKRREFSKQMKQMWKEFKQFKERKDAALNSLAEEGDFTVLEKIG
jgi:hypothetical protein